MTENLTAVWGKILGGKTDTVGRCGHIPIYVDEETGWLVFRHPTIFDGVEHVADPAKVDLLRRYVVTYLNAFPDTVSQLEKVGVRVRALITKPIKTQEDVRTWADSIFNTGPVSKLPQHVADTMSLMFDDYVIEVKSGRNPTWVLPVDFRESGNGSTVDFTDPQARHHKVYGPRHEFSKLAFKRQNEALARAKKEEEERNRVHRPRGRPRADGLRPGSDEAKEADRLKRENFKAQRRQESAARRAEKTSKNGQVVKLIRPPKEQVPDLAANA